MRHIALSHHRSWTGLIESKLDHSRFSPSFVDSERVDLARFDAALPLRIAHYPAMRAALAGDGRGFAPAEATVALCDDKLAFAQWLMANGFASNTPKPIEGAASARCILKPRHGEYGQGCRLVEAGTAPDGFFMQELIEGRVEYAVHALRVRGTLRYLGAIRYEMAGDAVVRGAAGLPMNVARVFADRFRPLTEALLAALDYEGTACLNLKPRGSDMMILELNPRFGGSLAHDVNAYVEAYCTAVEEAVD